MTIEFPGLFDLQVNGFAGVDFNAPTLTCDEISAALQSMRGTGVTRCLPTLITSSFDDFCARVRVLARMPSAAIAGIHMEGPYLSAEDGPRGAHPRAHVRAASLDDFKRRQDAADGRIVLVTLAPEVGGAVPLIEYLVSAGVRVALGHTAATPEQIAAAIGAGATLATHLGNGCEQMLPRHPNAIWELLAADRVFASLIVDGHHLPPATVKAMIRAKGADRTILVTDAVAAAGCVPRKRRHSEVVANGKTVSVPVSGAGSLAGVQAEVSAAGRVSLTGTPYLAGSTLTLDRAIGNTVRYTALAVQDVIPMASAIPAAYLAIPTAGTVTADWDPDAGELRVLRVLD
jgi:N-acetylglucosamine-6-phosphate deacetylase